MPHECTDCGRAFEDGSKQMLSGCPECGGTTFQFRPEGAGPSGGPDDPPEPPEPEVDGVARTVGNAASAVRNLVTGGSGAAGPPDADGRTPEAGPARDTGQAGAHEEAGQAGVHEEAGQAGVHEEAGGVSADDSTVSDETAEITGPSTGDWPGSDDAETDDGEHVTTTSSEETAQSDARGDIVEADELPSTPENPRDRPPVPDPRPLSVRDDEDDEDEDDEESADSATDADTDPGVTRGDDPEDRPSLSELRAELNDQFESIRVVEPGQYELNLMELYDREEYIIALQEDGKYTIQLPERWEER